MDTDINQTMGKMPAVSPNASHLNSKNGQQSENGPTSPRLNSRLMTLNIGSVHDSLDYKSRRKVVPKLKSHFITSANSPRSKASTRGAFDTRQTTSRLSTGR